MVEAKWYLQKMTSSYNIRPAQISDGAEICRLAAELGYPATFKEIGERLAAMLHLEAHFVVVAEGKNLLCGWIAAERRMLLETGERVEIVGLVVDARKRRFGVGRTLVEAALKWAANQQVKHIYVRSNIMREEAHSFYEGIGFIRKKTQHIYARELV